jgi:ribosome-associated heat shock protein Hsp15
MAAPGLMEQLRRGDTVTTGGARADDPLTPGQGRFRRAESVQADCRIVESEPPSSTWTFTRGTRAILERVTDPSATDETRIDRWLCAVRLVKTRPLATRLCEGGHVLVNGLAAKPSTRVRAGDRVEALIADRKCIVEVMRSIESRVGAAVAATCYVDHSPPVVPEAGPAMMLVRREGRPSKRLRRELERLRRAADA